MARILLRRHEVEDRELPYVCLRCGRPARLWKTKQFLLAAPSGVGAVGKLTRIEVPLCAAHRRHWLWRGLIGGGLGGLLVACFLIGLPAVAEPDTVPPAWRNTLALFFIPGFFGLALWLPVVLVLHFTAMRPTKITTDDITLAGVSPEFVTKLKEHRRLPPEERAVTRRARRRRRGDSPG